MVLCFISRGMGLNHNRKDPFSFQAKNMRTQNHKNKSKKDSRIQQKLRRKQQQNKKRIKNNTYTTGTPANKPKSTLATHLTQ